MSISIGDAYFTRCINIIDWCVRGASCYPGKYRILTAIRQFRSDLKVNGVDLGRGVAVNATPAGTRVILTSTLNGYDGSIGEFRGSKSIIVSVP